MDTKSKARQIVEAEFRRHKKGNKRKRRDDGDDYSSEEDAPRKRPSEGPLMTPSQVKTKSTSNASSLYRDRARERREGKINEDNLQQSVLGITAASTSRHDEAPEPKAPEESSEDNLEALFASVESAKEYILCHADPKSSLGRSMIQFWKSQWGEDLAKNSAGRNAKLRSTIYTFTTRTHPILWILPSEKSYTSAVPAAPPPPLLPDDLLGRLKQAFSKQVKKQEPAKMHTDEYQSNEVVEESDDDIFGGVGEYSGQDEEGTHTSTRVFAKGESLFDKKSDPMAAGDANSTTNQYSALNLRLMRLSSTQADADYGEDDDSHESTKKKKKSKKKKRGESESD